MTQQQQVVFSLRPEHADGFDAASIALQDGTSYDVKAALDAGGGKITLDASTDSQVITALAGFSPLSHDIVTASRSTRNKTTDQKGGGDA